MKTQFELEDIKAVSSTVVEMFSEKMGNYYHSPMVDSDGLAEYLSVPKSWVYERSRDKSKGSIPRIMVGKYVRFNVHDVLEWLQRQ